MNLLSHFSNAVARVARCGIASKLAAAVAFGGLASVASAADPVVVGSSVTLYATSDGSPAPTFQWRRNGVPIAGATSQSYVIASASTADNGSYSVVATNLLGSATSPDEVLTVQEPAVVNVAPSITTQPAATQIVAAGGSASFTVTANGTPAPTYQWRKNGVAIAGATSATFSLSNVSSGNGGEYTVVVTNAAGSVTSAAATLTVTDSSVAGTAPVILMQPVASQTVALNGTVTITVDASGSPTPTYQWRKNGATIAGATSSTLTLSPVSSGDAATYSVVVTNTVGSVTSSNSVLSVSGAAAGGGGNAGGGSTGGGSSSGGGSTGGGGVIGGGSTEIVPAITAQPVTSQSVTVGGGASISVTASGSPAPTFQWRRNGLNISGATKATYTIAAASASDAGTYTVLVSNSVGSIVSERSVLTVESSSKGSKPVIISQPASQYVADGASARFTVSVSAVPGASYQWRKNGYNIPGAISSSLAFSSVSSSDAGAYTVVATNPAGSVTSAVANLVIAGPPVITAQPQSKAVYIRSNVTLTVSAVGSPAPSYQWRKNGFNIPGATGATLVIKNVDRSDAGKYTVRVSNSVGWVVSTTATLMVENLLGRRDDDVSGSDSGVTAGTGSDVGASQLVNLSVRANAGSGSEGLIVGFVVDGAANKQVLIRGVGPTLQDFGVTAALADPSLSLFSGPNLTASNDDWITNENALLIEGVSAGVGAFGLRERGADAALMASLKTGAYTAQVSSKDASTGVALVEVYDTAANPSTRLVNLSVRAHVGGAEAPNVGFVIAGSTPKRVLIRAVGPALEAFGVTGVIADPKLEVYRGSTLVEQNDNWGGGEVYDSIFSRVGAFGFANPDSNDAVLFTVLEPGAYTVVVTGANGSSGVGLVELYEVP